MKTAAQPLAWRTSQLQRPRPPPLASGSRHHVRRHLNYLVYRTPSYVRKMQTVLPAVTAFNLESRGFTLPLVIKSDISDETRAAWLRVGKAAKARTLNRDPSPYITPALIKWFKKTPATFRVPVCFSSYFEKKAESQPAMYEMEIIRPARHAKPREMEGEGEGEGKGERKGNGHKRKQKESFRVSNLPFGALVQAFTSSWQPPFSLYMAQVPIDQLNPDLAADLPVPYLIGRAAPADIYSTSVWMGTEPTYTSLHRDPNPNYFLQLSGRKHVRLLRPDLGERLFHDVRVAIGAEPGNPRMRGQEMMTGPEKTALEQAIWGDWFPDPNGPPQPSDKVLDVGSYSAANAQHLNLEKSDLIWEAVVDPGDALFIPVGWWHSVRSSHADARLNASANWWFRYRQKPGQAPAPRRKPIRKPPERSSKFRGLRVKRIFLDSNPIPNRGPKRML